MARLEKPSLALQALTSRHTNPLVAVDTEQTSKQLIEKGQLRTRVTILPLNKLAARCVDADKVAKAKDIARARGATAALALELVGFDGEVRKAMEYAFGGAIVCDSSDAAKEIMQSTRTKAVTLDGDVFDPAGTMSGGAKSQIGTLLNKISDLAAAKASLDAQVRPRLESHASAAACACTPTCDPPSAFARPRRRNYRRRRPCCRAWRPRAPRRRTWRRTWTSSATRSRCRFSPLLKPHHPYLNPLSRSHLGPI